MQQYKKILGKVMMTAEGAYNSNKGYDPISLVTDEETGKSYISRQEVPVGTQINNREYWQPIASSGIIDNGVIILNRKNSDGQVPIYDLKSATEAVAIGDRKGGVILGFLGFNPETDTVPTWKLYQYNDVSPSNWTNIDYWLPMDYTNKYAGWFDNEEALYDSVPFPKVGMYAYVGNSVSSAIIYRCYNDRVWHPTEDKAFSGVVNLADEEDITSKQNKLKFKDKEYNPAQFSGLGKLYLRKNIVDGKNILTQTMMQATNTIYIIQYDYDLQGQTITIPEECTLDFQGGSFNNGRINGTNTKIVYSGSIFNNVIISGTWNIPIVDSVMFKDLSKDNELRNLFNLTNGEIQNDVILRNHGYNYISSFSYLHENFININSNTYIKLYGTIIVKGNEFNGYRVFFGSGVSNVKIEGSGNIIGDFYNDDEIIPSTGKHDLSKTQDYNGQTLSTHEYCHGITLYNCVDCEITGINISRFPGDGISLAQLNNDTLSNNIIIHNSKIHDCRRLGISVVGTRNTIIENNEIYRIKGTSPQAAIDIEPNSAEQSSYNTFIRNNYIHDCHEGIFMVGYHGWVKNVSIINNNIKNIESFGIYTSSRSNDPSDSNPQGVSNINILNNYLETKSIALNINNCRNVNIDNNYVITDSVGGYFNPANNGIKLTNNIIKGKGIGVLSASNITILGNSISGEKEGIGIEISALGSYGSEISYNNIIGKVKLYTYACNFSFNTITQKASPELFNNVGGTLISIVNNNFTVEESEDVTISTLMDSILRVNSSNHITIENNIFNIPDNTISNPIYIANTVSKASIKYNTFNGLAASQTITNYGTNIILEGLYSNFKKGTSVPEYKGQNRDTQSTQVMYVDSDTHKLIISDGTGNQYNALGETLT